jgi:2-oxoglutarate dehydrogenase E1 component
VLLLPHGYEGQGPEHSSARLERFLQLFAQENLLVANPTSAAQYFHLLRCQAKSLADERRPLVVMTPKSLLRNPMAASTLDELATGSFHPVLDDPMRAETPTDVTRLVLCSGKIGVELDSSPLRADARSVAVIRIELLAPFPVDELQQVISRYPNAQEIYWVQEEPRNMGAWTFVEPRLRQLLVAMERPMPIGYAGRTERASPAEGFLDRHALEQSRIIESALSAEPVRVSANGHHEANTATTSNGAARNGAKTKTARARAIP